MVLPWDTLTTEQLQKPTMISHIDQPKKSLWKILVLKKPWLFLKLKQRVAAKKTFEFFWKKKL